MCRLKYIVELHTYKNYQVIVIFVVTVSSEILNKQITVENEFVKEFWCHAGAFF